MFVYRDTIMSAHPSPAPARGVRGPPGKHTLLAITITTIIIITIITIITIISIAIITIITIITIILKHTLLATGWSQYWFCVWKGFA